MKAVSIVIQAVLILAVVTAATTMAVPYAQKTMKSSIESMEVSNVRADFLKCSDRILDTARTGSGNKCTISANEGKLSVKTDGLYYSLLSSSEICAPQDWAVVEANKQIWQRCTVSSGDKKNYELKWFYPKNDVVLLEGLVNVLSASSAPNGINYQLVQKGSLFVQFDSPKDLSGKVIELTRSAVSGDTTVISVNIVK